MIARRCRIAAIARRQLQHRNARSRPAWELALGALAIALPYAARAPVPVPYLRLAVAAHRGASAVIGHSSHPLGTPFEALDASLAPAAHAGRIHPQT
jgi:hypothetical protein